MAVAPRRRRPPRSLCHARPRPTSESVVPAKRASRPIFPHSLARPSSTCHPGRCYKRDQMTLFPCWRPARLGLASSSPDRGGSRHRPNRRQDPRASKPPMGTRRAQPSVFGGAVGGRRIVEQQRHAQAASAALPTIQRTEDEEIDRQTQKAA
jgi:hypothetical protein